jgi:hypothetical protein
MEPQDTELGASGTGGAQSSASACHRAGTTTTLTLTAGIIRYLCDRNGPSSKWRKRPELNRRPVLRGVGGWSTSAAFPLPKILQGLKIRAGAANTLLSPVNVTIPLDCNSKCHGEAKAGATATGHPTGRCTGRKHSGHGFRERSRLVRSRRRVNSRGLPDRFPQTARSRRSRISRYRAS